MNGIAASRRARPSRFWLGCSRESRAASRSTSPPGRGRNALARAGVRVLAVNFLQCFSFDEEVWG
jgi:hypothetical protein